MVSVPPEHESAMSEAVRLAAARAEPGSAVVLAPAAASMDMYTDYAHRGQEFTDSVRALLAESAVDPAERHRG